MIINGTVIVLMKDDKARRFGPAMHFVSISKCSLGAFVCSLFTKYNLISPRN